MALLSSKWVRSDTSPRVVDFKAVRYIFESGIKLEAKPQVVAMAATLYHRFFEECNPEDYDHYLIAATCLYLAGKVEENHLKIRDIVNVFHKAVHPQLEPLDLADEYWLLRDSIVQCELLLLRVMKFQVSVDHPHRTFCEDLGKDQLWKIMEDILSVYDAELLEN
ncbi:cyclin-Q-like isoform X3 [Tachypleus tridentatus]|uniref:cyclin-Q-like isoform X3 n=1 Tax=Tachypleus tridentatus TaxID=6853 RepID=UPI003FD59232